MPRPSLIIPTEQLCVRIPVDVKAKLDLTLFSELESRVPFGAYQSIITALIKEHLESDTLDLAPFLPGCPPGLAVVKGNAATIEQLRRILET